MTISNAHTYSSKLYIDGFEVALEGYLHNAELKTLALFDKPEPLCGPFFEETIYVTPSRLSQSTQSRIVESVAQACRAYGLRTGPIHAELRIDERDAWILEVASRTIGGDCSRSLDMGEEFNLEEFVISLAIGKPQTPRTPDEARGVMMIPIKERGILRRVEGLRDAQGVANVVSVDILVRSGHELVPLPERQPIPRIYICARPVPQRGGQCASPSALPVELRGRTDFQADRRINPAIELSLIAAAVLFLAAAARLIAGR